MIEVEKKIEQVPSQSEENSNEKKVILALKHVDVKFNVRGRILSAIRDITLNIYEHESLAIVGESGSGKSVLTKTFAGMLDSNGFISHGQIIFSDDTLSKTCCDLEGLNGKIYSRAKTKLLESSFNKFGSEEYKKIKELENYIESLTVFSEQEEEQYERKLKDATDALVEEKNYLQTLDKREEEDAIKYTESIRKIKELEEAVETIEKEKENVLKAKKQAIKDNPESILEAKNKIENLSKERINKITASKEAGADEKTKELVDLMAKEIILSVARFPIKQKLGFVRKLLKSFDEGFSKGTDFTVEKYRHRIFEPIVFRVAYRKTLEDGTLEGYAIVDCAKVKFTKDWQQIRGCRIATVFQDPMTSLNPIVTIGKQIMTVILKHQHCSYEEAKARAIDIMDKVGIPDPKKRFNDYPFQYSGGMRQRIVIAIALSCQPKILICDEPTTALDVTIQAQIIRLIKKLQKELGFTTVYITHDLGVVANVADRVAVLYGGQIQEIGTVEDIFYRPAHPYTWALLSSLPQLSERGKELFSIPGTPPSLYNKIVGDSFAPRNKYCMAIDLVKEPPMFQISETHFAKTWLLDPRAPKIDLPENIQNLHEKMLKTHTKIEG